jgi:hypothetical protein
MDRNLAIANRNELATQERNGSAVFRRRPFEIDDSNARIRS